MDYIKIMVLGVAISVIAAVVGEIKKEYRIPICVIGGIIILLTVLPETEKIIKEIYGIGEKADLNSSHVSIIIKCSGIACMSSLCSALCKDLGQSGVAEKVDLAGRIAVIITALPAINALIEVIGRTV